MTIAPDFHRMLGGLSFCTILVGFSVPAIAQVIPDDTLGGERSIVTRETIRGVDSDRIDGGSRQGRNLFHSFQQFDVQEGRGAYFSNPADVRNIFSRVTGVDRSEIMGRLGVLGDANLFFMNPNGIVFGPNSSLDVNGSFVGTTANAIQFGEQGFFSATNPEVPSELLTIDPSAFLFNQIGIGSIENSSRAPGRDPSDSFDTFGLQVEDGHSLLLLGGNLTFDQGGLVAFDGRIDLGAVAGTGTVGLNINGDALSLSFPDDLPRSDVTLTNGAGFLVTNTGTGSIVITAQNISVFEGSALGAGILSGQTSNGALPGNIILDAIGTITIADGSYAFNEIYSDAVGSSGDVVIDAAQLTVRDGGQVGILNSGEGTAGNLVVRASGSIELNGGASDSLTGLFSQVSSSGNGDTGEISIETQGLNLSSGGLIGAGTFGQGNSGRVRISVTGNVLLDGSSIFSDVASGVTGNSGDIEITANSLLATNGAQILSNTWGQGDSGQIVISVRDLISLEGEDVEGYPSGLFSSVHGTGRGSSGGVNVTASALEMSNSATILSNIDSSASGNSGGINVVANTIQMSGGSQLRASVAGSGNSGQISVTARDSISLDGRDRNDSGVPTAIFTRIDDGATETSEGIPSSTGGIYINTGLLSLTNRSQLGSTTAGVGNPGDIVVDARDRVFMQNTIIISEVSEQTGIGDAGDIQITTGTLDLQNGSSLLADTEYQGNAGNIIINARDAVILAGEGPSAFRLDDLVPSQITSTVDFVEPGEGTLDGESIGEGNAGDITIDTGTLLITDDGFIRTRTEGLGNAGDVTVNAQDWVRIDNGIISSSVIQGAIGVGGNIDITARSLSLDNEAALVTGTSGKGDAGNVSIRADEMQLFNSSNINSGVRAGGVGDGGNVEIQSRSISLVNGSQINSFVARPETDIEGNVISGGQGSGGDLRITATDSIALTGTDENGLSSGFFTLSERNALGEAGNITLKTGNLRIADGAAIVASTYSDYRGGNILVNADNLEAINGGQIVAATRSNGNAGAIQVNVTGDLTLSGVDANFADRQERARQYIPESDGRFAEVSDIILNEGAASGIFGNTTPGSTGIGGTITLSVDRLFLTDGATLLAATSGSGSAGSITIANADTVSLDNAMISTEIASGAMLSNPTANQGNIDIQTRSLNLANADITASTSGQGNAGRINIQSKDRISLDRSTISTAVNTLDTIGNGGNITIETALLNLSNQSEISSSTSGQGNSGRIEIQNADRIRLNNSTISTAINEGAITTEPSNITLQTRSLNLSNNSNITASTAGQGDAGTIVIGGIDRNTNQRTSQSANQRTNSNSSADRVVLSDSVIATDVQRTGRGRGGNIQIRSNALTLDDGSRISARTQGQGQAGDIDVFAAIVSLSNGSRLLTNTSSDRNAGNITLTVNDWITIDGSQSGIFASTTRDSQGNGGFIQLNSNDIILDQQGQISAQSQGRGQAGRIQMQATGDLTLNDRSTISTQSQRNQAGGILIQADQIEATNSDITTSARRSSGGNIRLNASQIRLYGDSDLRTASGEEGGSITLSADSIIAFDDSDIFAFAGVRGGDIQLDTSAFFGNQYQSSSASENPAGLDGNDRTDINASGQVSSGEIATPDTSFIQNSLTDLPESAIDTEALISSSCVVRRDTQSGTFIITGTDGLPERPGNTTQSQFPTGEVRSIPDATAHAEEGWQIGDSIVEPQGVYQLPDGQLILSRECSD